MSLSATIAAPRSGSFGSALTYRKYGAVLSTSTQVNGVTDTSNKRILYEVGLRHKTLVGALAPTPDDVIACNTAYSTRDSTSELFNGLARKFSNFTGNFEAANLVGIVVRVARGLACDSAYPEGVSAGDLLGGRALRVHALGTYFAPVSASAETVFIPRIVDTVMSPDVFSVLCHAVCGEGGIVATDALEVNPATRAPIVPDVDAYAFAPACVDALRILGSNMAMTGQGELFALGVVKGLNDVLSVVGHTDEGGVTRDILRQCATGVPFGGIHAGLPEYTGLPALATCEGSVVAGYCDSLLLSAAALVAHCDPGVTYCGSWLPTVLTASRSGEEYKQSGETTPAAPWMSKANRGSLRRVFEPFARTYTAGLAKLFGLASEGGPAAQLLTSGLMGLGDTNRHLNYPVVAPFFWIEPTSLIPHDYLGTQVEKEGFAAACTRYAHREIPLWETATRTGRGGEHASNLLIRFRGARACGFLTHFWGHAEDGVACVRVRQVDPEGVLLPGPVPLGTVAATVRGGCHLGELLWRRGQSPLPAPSELINLGESIGVQVRHFSLDDEGHVATNHCPSDREVVAGSVVATVSGLVGLAPGALTEVPREARRARTQAGRSLSAAVAGMARYGSPVVDDLPILLSAPALPRRAQMEKLDSTPVSEGSGQMLVREAEAAHQRDVSEPNEGLPLAAVMSAAADSGPRSSLSHRPGGGAVKPTDPANVRADPAALSETSAVGPAPAPQLSTTGAAPSERAGQQ
nr:coat protein [Ustilaginoidea virens RNA virus 7]